MSSYNLFNKEITDWVKANFIKGSTCLDMGAGEGKYYDLLGDWLEMDAVEAFHPNIVTHNLERRYRHVYCADIRHFTYGFTTRPAYNLVIFGDVIEHMSVAEAQLVLAFALSRSDDVLVAVPWRYKQGAIYGNPFEVHVQDDLTPQIFEERYHGFEPLFVNEQYGIYHKAP